MQQRNPSFWNHFQAGNLHLSEIRFVSAPIKNTKSYVDSTCMYKYTSIHVRIHHYTSVFISPFQEHFRPWDSVTLKTEYHTNK